MQFNFKCMLDLKQMFYKKLAKRVIKLQSMKNQQRKREKDKLKKEKKRIETERASGQTFQVKPA